MNKFYLSIYKKELQRLPLMVLLFCLPMLSIPVHGQTNEISLDVPRIVPVSPAVTAMEKYQSYPVSYCTGIPEITIPLYEIVAGEVTIPVSLSYHASGLKPKEQSGIAGTGWTLNLEPSVSRQVNGMPDESRYGWLYRNGSWNTRPTDKRELFKYYADKTDNKHDTQPDKFTYKLPHGGGSGYFSSRFSKLTTIPYNEDVVRYDYINFYIKDGKGINYTFDGAYEKCDIYGDYNNYVTRWLCSSIKSARNPQQELVSFSYETMTNLLHPSNYYNLDGRVIFSDKQYAGRHRAIMIEEDSGHSFRYYRIEGGSDEEATLQSIPPSSAGTYFTPSLSYIQGRMSVTLLTNAYFMGNRLSASYKTVGNPTEGTQSTVIDQMEVTDARGGLIRKIKFYITPYNDRTSLTKLDSLRISAPGAEDRTYSFHYNSSFSVPSVYTTAVDHWGFYNGSGGGKTVPSLSHSMSVNIDGLGNMQQRIIKYAGADRESHAGSAQIGVLDIITDPQGIQTRFSYEGNSGLFFKMSYWPDNYLHPVGGIRVARIEAYDPHTRKRITKVYKYGLRVHGNQDDFTWWGGGAIKHIVTYRDYCSTMAIKVKDPSTKVVAHEDLTIYNSMPVSNITFNNGSAVMYNTVSEEVYGSEDGVNLTTIYNYDVDLHPWYQELEWDMNPGSTIEDFLKKSVRAEDLVRPKPYLAHEFSDDYVSSMGSSNQDNGKLLYTQYYRDGKIIERVDNVYKYKYCSRGDFQMTIPEKRIVVDPDVMMEDNINMDDIYHIHTYYPDVYVDIVLDKTIRKKYYRVSSGETVSTTEQQYEYDYYGFIEEESIKPHIVKTIGSDNVTTIDQYEYLPGYPAILSAHKHTEGDKYHESRVLFKPGSCLPEKVQWRTDRMGEFRDEVIYRCYDGNNNVTEIVGKDGIPISFIWGYQNRFPIARIENATIAEVYAAISMSQMGADECAASAAIPNGVWDKVNSLRGKLPHARVTTYDYQPLHGVAMVVDPNNVTTKFNYDSYSRLTEGYFLDEESRKVMLQKFVYHFGK